MFFNYFQNNSLNFLVFSFSLSNSHFLSSNSHIILNKLNLFDFNLLKFKSILGAHTSNIPNFVLFICHFQIFFTISVHIASCQLFLLYLFLPHLYSTTASIFPKNSSSPSVNISASCLSQLVIFR